MEKILQRANGRIYCNHCEKEVAHVWICRMDSIIGTRYAMLCISYQKLIRIYSSMDFNKQKNPQT
jgi:hypothetical protein